MEQFQWFLLAIAALGVYALARIHLRRQRIRQAGERAEGIPIEIVSILLPPDGLGSPAREGGWYVKYRYVDSGGTVREGKSEVLYEDPRLYLVGGKGEVRYDRDHPERSAWVIQSVAGASPLDVAQAWFNMHGRK